MLGRLVGAPDRPTPAGTGDGDAGEAARADGSVRLPYLTGLDGLRAVALLAVLTFLHGFG